VLVNTVILSHVWFGNGGKYYFDKQEQICRVVENENFLSLHFGTLDFFQFFVLSLSKLCFASYIAECVYLALV